MGLLFDSKATRIAKHQQIIELARATLDQLQLRTYKNNDGATVPVWTEEAERRIPLRGTVALPDVTTIPVGIVFSFPVLPRGYVPSSGMTLYATWSWMLAGWRCDC